MNNFKKYINGGITIEKLLKYGIIEDTPTNGRELRTKSNIRVITPNPPLISRLIIRYSGFITTSVVGTNENSETNFSIDFLETD